MTRASAITDAAWNGTCTVATSMHSTTTGASTSACSITTTREAMFPEPPSRTRRSSTSPARGNGHRSSTRTASTIPSEYPIPRTAGISMRRRTIRSTMYGRSTPTSGGRNTREATAGSNNGDFLNYTDWKLGVTWLVAGYNVGAYYSDTNAKDSGYTIAGRNIGKSTGTVFIQKTF